MSDERQGETSHSGSNSAAVNGGAACPRCRARGRCAQSGTYRVASSGTPIGSRRCWTYWMQSAPPKELPLGMIGVRVSNCSQAEHCQSLAASESRRCPGACGRGMRADKSEWGLGAHHGRGHRRRLTTGDNPDKTGPGEWRPAGESARVTSRPNGIDRDPKRVGGRRQRVGRKRSPAQSNHRAEHEAHSTRNITGISTERRR